MSDVEKRIEVLEYAVGLLLGEAPDDAKLYDDKVLYELHAKAWDRRMEKKLRQRRKKMIECRKCESRFEMWTVAELIETGFKIEPHVQEGFAAMHVDENETQLELCSNCFLAHFGGERKMYPEPELQHTPENCRKCAEDHKKFAEEIKKKELARRSRNENAKKGPKPGVCSVTDAMC